MKTTATINPHRYDAVLFDLDCVLGEAAGVRSANGDRAARAVVESTVDLVRRLQAAGVRTAVHSSSRASAAVLDAAGLGELFPVRVDGTTAADLGLPAAPDPAVLVEAARCLDAVPSQTAIVQSTLGGVEAGRRGGFALVVGVAGTGTQDFWVHGADVVVADLAAVEVGARASRRLSEVPTARDGLLEFRDVVSDGRLAVFLDFDGALSPIVDEPDAAVPAEGAQDALRRLSARCPVAIVSGRGLKDVRRRVGVEGIWYAGSHGFELAGPNGESHEFDGAKAAVRALDEAERELRERLEGLPGAIVERKKYSVTSHYRMVAPERRDEVTDVVVDVASRHPELRPTRARMAGELVPNLKWDKGYAVRWLLGELSPADWRLAPFYAGDDLTDEDALEVVHDVGLGVVVRSTEHGDRPTVAHLAVDAPEELCALLDQIAGILETEVRP